MAIALTLVGVVLVSASVYDVLLAREAALASSYLPVHCAAGAGNSDSSGYAAFPRSAYPSDDGYVCERWGLRQIEAPRAWQITRGHRAIIVAVLDTGISKDNRGLADRVVAEINLTDSPTSDDLHGHGTHMAGAIAAIAPELKLMNVNVADDSGRCDPSVVARGIIWAVDHGANIINLSLSVTPSPEVEE